MLERAMSHAMALRLDGKQLAAELEERLSKEIAAGTAQAGRPPGLAVLRVGDDPASGVYVANKEKACARIGVASYGSHLPQDSTQQEVLDAIAALNADSRVDGILLQLPLPAGLDEGPLLAAIDPDKDADGLPLNLVPFKSLASQLHACGGDGLTRSPSVPLRRQPCCGGGSEHSGRRWR